MPKSFRLEEPFRESSIRDRRTLLALSLITGFVGWTGIMPDKIPFLGMDFTGNKTSIAVFMLFVLAFSLFSFVSRGLQDYTDLAASLVDATLETSKKDVDTETRYKLLEQVMQVLMGRRRSKSRTQIVVPMADYWLPIGFGLASFVALLYRTLRGFGF